MKKKHYRDYATEAFRFWSEEGPADQYKQRLWDEAIRRQHQAEGRSGLSNPTEAAIRRAEDELQQKEAQVSDLDAVDKAMKIMRALPEGKDMIAALRIVYMEESQRDFKRGEIQARIIYAAQEIGVSISTVYRWLAYARYIFAYERGLRT